MAEKSILDTTILIDALDHGRHIDLLQGENSISVVSIYEFIRYKKKMLENKLLLEDSFDVIAITNPTLLKAAEIFVKLRQNGVTINENDIHIASAALVHNLKLYTKDRDFLEIKKHFEEFKMQFFKD
jgi:predicted nucleic acid-binding protein